MRTLRNFFVLSGSKSPLLLISFAMVSVLLLMTTQAQAVASGTLFLMDDVGDNSLYTVNTTTAALTLVGPGGCDGLAPSEDPTNFLYCANNVPNLFTVATDGSGLTFVAPIGGDANRGLAFNTSNGMLYGTDNQVFGTIDTTTGAFSPLASPPEESEALAADPNNNLIYALERDDNGDLMVYDIGANTWGIIGPTGVADGVQAGLAFDPITNILFAADRDGGLYRINPSNGETVFIGDTGIDDPVGLAFVPREISAIPTMTQWGMIIFVVFAGLAALYYMRRRLYKQRASS